MKKSNAKLRQYFLNNLREAEIEEIELRIISDADFAQDLEEVETELIEAYLEGTLSNDEVKYFETNYLVTEERQKRLFFLKALKQYAQKSSLRTEIKAAPPRFFESLKNSLISLKFATALGGAVLVLLIGISGYFVWKNYSNNSKVLISLNKAYKNERPFEARITAFDYAPPGDGKRGADDKKENLDLVFAKSRAAEEVLKNPTAENLHQLGQVYLAEKSFDEAIDQFEKGLRKSPDIASLHNDLGVALLEKSKLKEDGKLGNLAKANGEISKAIELNPKLLDAYFNKALCIEDLNLPDQATEAWREYLKLDANSPWAREAAIHLQKLETNKPVSRTREEILQDFLTAQQANDTEKAWQLLSRNRELITGKLIPQQLAFLFVNSKSKGDNATSQKALDALVYAGNLEAKKSGDLFWRDLAKFYANVPNEKISILKQAQDAYFVKGVGAVLNGEYKQAITELGIAQNLYQQANNTLDSKMLDFLIGYCKNRDSKIIESNELLNKLADFSGKANYKWLETQSITWLATNDYSMKRFSDSITKLKSAYKIAKETGDLFSQQKILNQFAQVYYLVGQFEKSLDSMQENFELGKLPDSSPREKWRALTSTAQLFYKIKDFQSAVLYEQEGMSLADKLDDISFKFTSSVDLGLINGTLGYFDTALDFIQKGRGFSENFPDSDYKKLCNAITNLRLGHVERQKKHYAESTEYYQKAINYYDSGDFQVDGYDAHRGLLQSYFAENNDPAFQAELPKILNIFETYREKIIEEQNRSSFFDNEQDVYDIAIEYEFGKANFVKAFDYSEESRSRSLLDLQNSAVEISTDEKQPEIKFSTNLYEPLKFTQIQAEMPENTQFLEYMVLPDKVLIWSISKDGLAVAKTEISSAVLQDKVTDYLELVAKNDQPDEQLNLSKELYQILINPIKDKLDAGKEIFIIPDKVLFRLPFATLFSDKYLIEDFKISYSPSANVFLICSKKAKEFSDQSAENLLIIGNPTFNPADYENTLSSLPSAKQEAVEIAKMYENPTLLTDKEATKARVKESLKTADIIHFAGHYLVDERSPLLSGLVLAGNPKDGSNLANYEIIGEKLPHTRLIVLSACDTGIEKYYKSEGMIGVSRTFLATGVPLVLASQWAVNSEATKELMIHFHDLRKTEKFSTAESLRQSQIAMLKDERFKQPYYWAAFATIGGYAQF